MGQIDGEHDSLLLLRGREYIHRAFLGAASHMKNPERTNTRMARTPLVPIRLLPDPLLLLLLAVGVGVETGVAVGVGGDDDPACGVGGGTCVGGGEVAVGCGVGVGCVTLTPMA